LGFLGRDDGEKGAAGTARKAKRQILDNIAGRSHIGIDHAMESQMAATGMAETGNGTAKVDGANRKKSQVAPGSEVADLAGLLISTSRIASHLETALSAAGSPVSLTDWLLLHTLNAEGPLPASRVAYKIGVTRQRVHQQVGPLRKAELLEVTDADGKSKVLTLTSAGTALIHQLEQQVMKALSAKDGEIPVSQIRTASMGARRIVRAISPQRDPKPEPE
jgi:DNA-binding MarR family transcriptional regulator